MTEAEKEEAERLAVVEDEKIVDGELQRYEADGIIDDDHPESDDFDILRYWQVRLFIYIYCLILTACCSPSKLRTHCYEKLCSIFCQCKPPLSLANALSHQARRLTLFITQTCC